MVHNVKIVDTHAHICDTAFDADRGAILKRAEDSGVAAVIAVGEDLSDARRNLELALEYPVLRPAAGLYPTHLDPGQAEAMTAFIRRERDRLCAIGEVGLDYWAVKEDAEREIQRAIFADFIALAREQDLPLNVHSRSAGHYALDLLLSKGAQRVQLHAYDGKLGPALEAARAGYFFSIPPSVLRSRQKQRLVKGLPLSCLLVETDSPVLGPQPAERNEPVNALLVVDAIAKIKGKAKEEVLEVLFENTLHLYGDLKLP